MTKLVIFDMDGTIADTSAGIYASYNHVARELNRPLPSNKDLSSVIGGPLPNNLKKIYNLTDDQVEKAVNIYREYYAKEGFKESVLYEGLAETISKLYKKGSVLAVATMKAETFAIKMLEMWDIADKFSFIYGVDQKDSITKPEMIRKCLLNSNIEKKDTFMIGDSPQDYDAAKKSGVNFLAVTYGFHYTEEFCISNNLKFVNKASDIFLFIEQHS